MKIRLKVTVFDDSGKNRIEIENTHELLPQMPLPKAIRFAAEKLSEQINLTNEQKRHD